MHGSKDRAKDASPGACDDLSCLRWVHTHRSRMPTAFPSSASFGHPLSSARLMSREDKPATRVGPTEVFVPTPPREERCLPENRDALDRHDTRRMSVTRRDRSLRPSRPALSLTPPTLFPQRRGQCLGWALQGHGAVTRGSVNSLTIRGSRVQTPFSPVGSETYAPGTDDPSAPTSSTGPAVDEDRLPRSHRCRSQRLDGFYDREPAARCAANFMSAVMPETDRTRNKINRPSITFLSTWLSTARLAHGTAEITAYLVFRVDFHGKCRASVRAWSNNVI